MFSPLSLRRQIAFYLHNHGLLNSWGFLNCVTAWSKIKKEAIVTTNIAAAAAAAAADCQQERDI